MAIHIEHVAAQPVTATPDAAASQGLLARALSHLHSTMCGLHGHDPLLAFEGNRVFLRCTSCGHETPGWGTGERRPRQRFAGDSARHQLARPDQPTPVS